MSVKPIRNTVWSRSGVLQLFDRTLKFMKGYLRVVIYLFAWAEILVVRLDVVSDFVVDEFSIVVSV